MLFFCGVRVVKGDDGYYTDPVNWFRLRLLLDPFSSVQLVAVSATSKGSDWIKLSPSVQVIEGQPDFQPRGKSSSFAKKLLFVLWLTILPWRFFFHAKRAEAVGFVWLSEPISMTGLLLALFWKKPLMSVTIGSSYKSFLPKNRPSLSTIDRWRNHIVVNIARFVDRLMIRHSRLLLTAGPRLAEELGRGTAFSTGVFSSDDIYTRTDTCIGDQIRWVYSGAITTQKGVDTFLRALAKAREIDPRHIALLIGSVDPKFDLQSLLRELDLEPYVTVTGKIPWESVLTLLREGDIYVFLSLHEGMPKAPLEAMSQGLPVIATATGTEQFLQHEDNGLLVPVNDADAVMQAVFRIVNDASLRQRILRNARQTAFENSYEQNVHKVTNIIRENFPTLVSDNSVGHS